MGPGPDAASTPVVLVEGEVASRERDNYAFGQTLDFSLELMPMLSEPFDFDITRTLVFYALTRASVSHLNHHRKIRDDAVGGIFPNDMRRAVSILSIADFLAMPYETVRRHVHALVAAGWCDRVGSREFIVRSEILSDARLSSKRQTVIDLTKTFVTRMHTEVVSAPTGKEPV